MEIKTEKPLIVYSTREATLRELIMYAKDPLFYFV